MSVDLPLRLLRVPSPSDDKYSRGVVGFVTGSETYPGAALLGVTGAMRTGIGLIRYLGPKSVERLILETRPEVVCGSGRADAWVLGSGVDPNDPVRVSELGAAFSFDGLKVLDALAIQVAEYSVLSPETAILTPHAGELARLLDRFGKHFDLDYEAVQAAAAITNQLVILKGNTTLIAEPSGSVIAIGPNPTALATAGTGDVLAGILGALLATNVGDPNLDLVDVAVLGVSIHAEAADRAARSGPVAALDVAEAVRVVVHDWQLVGE